MKERHRMEETMNADYSLRISDEQRRLYRDEGYMFLEKAIPDRDLEMLRSECASLVRAQDEEMERKGTDVLNLSRKNSRYFVFLAYRDRPQLGSFIFSDLMAEICKATIGKDAMLFWEQFVVKGTDKKGAEFGWHQDSGYVDHPHRPYVNAWIPLDDVNEENGTISVLPFSRAGVREKVEHKPVPNSSDRVGYFGNDPGISFNAPAGSIAVFSSVTFHRSGANATSKMRRAYAVQWSPDTIYEPDGSLKGLAEQFLKDGRRVR
ncbi:MAG TPA: phytanoyl-CoA dioxygenase family protein [Bacteroidota bacterium]|nr:phytanoyl-CoA dioxygenase family protein [Bacteroidota bacterium]